ncbi:MAG: N-acetylornithine carbamoyltransferase [Candidatus Sumerlaeia bacterium]|nr:N-acetylornithine carbamoyltransferase [Candidatus Sumerlaeia bacterium]
MTKPLESFMAPQDLTLEETCELLELAKELKKDPIRRDLYGKTLAMIFFNQSLRTRMSFDIAMNQLGGHASILDIGAGTWDLEHRDDVVMDGSASEHIREAARVTSRYADAIALRAFPKYDTNWEENRRELIHNGFIREGTVPLINMESPLHHPCQGLADILTIHEKLGPPKQVPIVISWGWHMKPLPMAVTDSIFVEAAKHGMEVRLAHPEGWELDPEITATAETLASQAGGSVKVYNDLDEALPGARAVYFKSWGSLRNYGNPQKEMAEALAHREKWHLTMDHMRRTDKGIFMHCLPARRGVEVAAEVFEDPCNATTDEAENRLHVQKALLLKMLG